tara:strand:+ start:3671 stop:4732 length:1062 start_codon:yes stop_codon:yes gene_type:complete
MQTTFTETGNNMADEVSNLMDDNRAAITRLFKGVLRRDCSPEELESLLRQFQNGLTIERLLEIMVNGQEFANQTRVKTFVPAGHFYSPVVDPEEAEAYLDARSGDFDADELIGIPLRRHDIVDTWHTLVPYMKALPFEAGQKHPYRYQFDNTMYGWGDGSVLSAMISVYKPKRIIEIGSGWSSACAFDTVQRIAKLDTKLTFVEPYTQILNDVMGDDYRKLEILETPVQKTPIAMYENLAAGDILFIDSTHVMRTGSDVVFELFEILPRLAPGVLVHFHDMFWPFEYPKNWAIIENRSWNELYAVRAFLTNNDAWRVVFFNDYMRCIEGDLVKCTYPEFFNNSGGALWLEKKR